MNFWRYLRLGWVALGLWMGLVIPAWGESGKVKRSLEIMPNIQTLSSASSQPAKRLTPKPAKRAPKGAEHSFRGRKKGRDNKGGHLKRRSPLLVQSRIPFAVTMLGGLGAMVTGLFLVGNENTAANILLSSGTSMLFASVSSYMWWSPNLYLGMLGSLLGTASLVGGIVLATGVTGLPLEMGWGLLGATAVHLILNLVGWLNLRGLLGARKKKSHPAAKASAVSWVRDVRVAPYVTAQQAGLSCFFSF